MEKTSLFRKSLAWILVIAVAITTLITTYSLNQEKTEEDTASYLEEIESKRDEFVKHFKLSDVLSE